jgi:hypothetical protein
MSRRWGWGFLVLSTHHLRGGLISCALPALGLGFGVRLGRATRCRRKNRTEDLPVHGMEYWDAFGAQVKT